MTLLDEIIDTAEQLCEHHILQNPSDKEIVEELSKCVRVPLAFNSTGAKLAIAAYRRYDVETLFNAA